MMHAIFSIPVSRKIASLYARTAVAAHRAAAGCALKTTAFPAATMLTILPLSVGIGMRARRDRAHHSKRGVFLQRDAVVAAQRVRCSHSTPGTSLMILSFSILWSSRPIFVSSSSTRPRFRRCLGHVLDDRDNLAAGFDALLLQLQERFLRGVAGLVRVLENAEPPRARCRSCADAAVRLKKTSGLDAGSSQARAANDVGDNLADGRFVERQPLLGYVPGVIDFFAEHIDAVHDSNDHGVDRQVFQSAAPIAPSSPWQKITTRQYPRRRCPPRRSYCCRA